MSWSNDHRAHTIPFQTYTGRMLDITAIRPEDIAIEDIAHHLAQEPRYGGACRFHYSVAEHSILVSRHVPPAYARAALLHDAGEAYYKDQHVALKSVIREMSTRYDPDNGWDDFTIEIDFAISERFNVRRTDTCRKMVDAIDKRIVKDEINACLTRPEAFDEYLRDVQAVGADIVGYSWERAEVAFLLRFYELFPEAV